MNLTEAFERYTPDWLVRVGIRALLRRRLVAETAKSGASDFTRSLSEGPLALQTGLSKEQHYEVPTEFFRLALGPHLKYSSCLWSESTKDLGEAEAEMLRISCERAELRDGMEILELGCGWGSLTLWMAAKFPNSVITAVSHSRTQREYINAQCEKRKLTNVSVITCDMNDFTIERRFDRVVSIEMFEHMRNYRLLMERVASWLKPDGKLFVHIFCHKTFTYPFEREGAANWMGRYFFSGGMMPGYDLLPSFNQHLQLLDRWKVNGTHYANTARAWTENLDRRRAEILALFAQCYGDKKELWCARWRIFFVACDELFRYADGNEWFVGHYLFKRAAA